MGWISPTSHSDPDTKWNSEASAYDDDTGTYAYNPITEYGYYLELNHAALSCSKVRIYPTSYYSGSSQDPDVAIDVYYSSAWHNIHSGVLSPYSNWHEISIGSTQTVTAARVKWNSNTQYNYLWEFDFWEVEAPTVTTQAVSSIAPTTATGNGNITTTGGEDASAQGVCYNKTSPTGLPGWANRIKLTIDHTKIDATLTHFPVLLYLSAASGIGDVDASCVFDELTSDANRKKIAVTKADGTTELKVEIEKWDDTNEKAWLHASLAAWEISSTVDTVLYLYYDSTHADNTDYVGDTNSEVAEGVWDANFKAVYHMADGASTSAIYDSTSNDNDGTKKGAAEPAVTTSGKVANAQNFDGSDDFINIGTMGTYGAGGEFTFSTWVKSSVVDTTQDLAGALNTGSVTAFMPASLNRNKDGNVSQGRIRVFLRDEDNHWITAAVQTDTGITDGDWHHLLVTAKGSTNTVTIYVDGVAQTVESDTQTTPDNFANYGFGMMLGGANSRGTLANPLLGIMDEPRFSSTIRVAAWAAATYDSLWDNLITFGTEESQYTAAGTGSGGTGAFTASMTSLTEGTKYYVRAYATNSAGTSYGAEVEFTTGWTSPTGFVDGDSAWNNEANTYDDDTSTNADTSTADSYLELTHASLYCDKVRIFATEEEVSFPFNYHDPDISIDVYYSLDWHNIFSGSITHDTWIEKEIGSTQQVTAARVKADSITYNSVLFWEFDFHATTAVTYIPRHSGSVGVLMF